MFDTLQVNTSTAGDYSYFVGNDLRNDISEFTKRYASKKAFALVDAFVLKHHRSYFEEPLREQFTDLKIFEIPRGEQAKSADVYLKLLDHVLGNNADRSTPVFAIGGGVTGDLSGFVAATALRGLPLIHIPTTLLAMVDSSIGGKTGVNHKTGKNLIGSFYQPEAVFADVSYLRTLPEKEWVNGMSEILKYGMIHSPDIIGQLKELTDSEIDMDGNSWLDLIRQSAQIKIDVVSEDVLEAGKRAFLNFGHTYGHVLENLGNYSTYSHGEAVYAGMVGATYASNKLGSQIDLSNLLQFRSLYDFDLHGITQKPAQLVDLMMRDKKVKDGTLRLVLLKDLGEPYLYRVAEKTFVEDSWQQTLKIFY
ncbi:3-dehydroquinate synthase [Gracilimonas amylolytica]|uniref:3-dehydroquinate synthase n=1 Tax=Gracilimonas amylolytica TaxID=1749045 RepID=UPI000CD88179|nr:3-dehydroquinate synthase [Gracilimonas amylolytica]